MHFGSGVPSHLYVYGSIRLQRISNQLKSSSRHPSEKFHEVMSPRCVKVESRHLGVRCTLSFHSLPVDSLANGLKVTAFGIIRANLKKSDPDNVGQSHGVKKK